MIKKFLNLTLILAVVMLACQTSWGQEEEMEFDEEEYEFAYGNIVSIENGLITISEYNFETDEEEPVGYVMNRETRFQNVSGLDELAEGDEVDILYEIEAGERIARMISKTVFEEEMEEMITEADYGQEE